MRTNPRALAKGAARALAVAAVAAGGVAVVANPAYAAVPTVTGVFVAGSTTNKVVTAGTTVVINGTGFSGMTDNAADPACSISPVAYPVTGSGCSQVRFVGLASTATAGYALATRYTVISDTQIYATVPTITPSDGVAVGSPVAGTGLIKVQVVNTMGTGSSSLGSVVGTTSDLFYRHALTAALTSTTVTANPLGGGTVAVGVSPIAALTTTTLPLEKLTAYVTSLAAGSPTVVVASVTFNNATTVNVTLPPGSPAGNLVGVMLVHDGIAGTADADSLKYPAVITKLESCSTDVAGLATTITLPLPTCTGTATAPGTDGSNADVKVTGKGLTGATAWSFDGAGGTVVETCTVISDTLAYCDLAITTVPSPAVAAVTYTPADPDAAGPVTAPALAPTAGSILIYSSLV